jgi:CRISPR-associated protein Cas5t
MEATFTLELVAEQPGDFVGEVVVKSEVNVLTLTVSAKVLPAAQPEADAAAGTAGDEEDEEGVVAGGGEGVVASSMPGSAGASPAVQ